MSLRGNQLFGHKGTNKRAKYKNNFLFFFSERKYFLGAAIKVRISEQNMKPLFCLPDDSVWLLPRLFFKKSGFFDPLSAKSVKKLDNFHRKKRFFDFFLR